MKEPIEQCEHIMNMDDYDKQFYKDEPFCEICLENMS